MKKKPGAPLGIMASFSQVSFKKDGAEVFSARVHSGGCFGPDDVADVIDRGYHELNAAIKAGKLSDTARDFNAVAVGSTEYAVQSKTATHVVASKIGTLKK